MKAEGHAVGGEGIGEDRQVGIEEVDEVPVLLVAVEDRVDPAPDERGDPRPLVRGHEADRDPERGLPELQRLPNLAAPVGPLVVAVGGVERPAVAVEVEGELDVVHDLLVVLDAAVDAVEVALLREVEITHVQEERLVAAREVGADPQVEAARAGAARARHQKGQQGQAQDRSSHGDSPFGPKAPSVGPRGGLLGLSVLPVSRMDASILRPETAPFRGVLGPRPARLSSRGDDPTLAVGRTVGWRRRPESNRRIEVLQTSALATWLRRPRSDYNGVLHRDQGGDPLDEKAPRGYFRDRSGRE